VGAQGFWTSKEVNLASFTYWVRLESWKWRYRVFCMHSITAAHLFLLIVAYSTFFEADGQPVFSRIFNPSFHPCIRCSLIHIIRLQTREISSFDSKSRTSRSASTISVSPRKEPSNKDRRPPLFQNSGYPGPFCPGDN
jgi:hypothetical protein